MRKAVSTFLLTLLLAGTMSAATFDRVTDRDLLDHADLVVVATVVDSSVRETVDGRIYTDTRLAIEDILKGQAGTEVVVSQLGGFIGDRGIVMPGTATYAVGSRVLTFLRHRDDHTYYTAFMALGSYRFEHGLGGEILVRDAEGIEMLEGEPVDARGATEFVEAIRMGTPELAQRVPHLAAQTSRTFVPKTNAVASAYALVATNASITNPYRWNCPGSCTKNWRVDDTPQPGVDQITGLNNATELWTNEPYAFISLGLSGSHSNNTNVSGTDSDIVLAGTSTHPDCASGIACAITTISGTHTYDGEDWYTIVGADVVIEASVTSQSLFEVVAAHELGHAIGIRHSNQSGRSPNTSQAIMNSSVPSGLSLRTWDREAVSLIYGNGLPCSSVVINSTTGSGNVTSGNTKNLSVNASGTTPLTYQWYEGPTGNTSTPVGTNSSSYTTPPITVQKQYWVRVSNSCPSSADSATITITPQAGCDQPNIVTQPQNAQVTTGGTATLNVAATGDQPITYTWFRGAVGDTSNQVGTGQSFTTPPLTQTTTYWARATNQCGTKNSTLATVTVSAQCTPPSISSQPANASVALGESATLTVAAAGTSPFTYQWYQGDAGNETQPIGGANSASYSPGPFNTAGAFKYWVKVTNGCNSPNSANSNTVTVTAGGCVPVTINGQATNVNVPIGQGATLNVTPAGTSPFTYQWYQGDAGNETQPIGGQTNSSYAAGPFNTAGTYKFWVKVGNGCGSVNSLTIIVSVACAEATTPEIAAPPASHFSLAYDVSWTGDVAVTPTFELQEATNDAFTANVKTFIVSGAKKKSILAHLDIANDTRFYYRVRGINGCTSIPTAYSTATSTVVTRPQPENSTTFSISVPDGTNETLTQDMLVPGFGETATAGDSFGISIDVPWLTVFPATGALSAGGTTVQLTIHPASLEVGTTTGTVVVQRTQPSSGKFTTNGATSASLPFSVSLVTPVTPTPRSGSAPPGTMIIPAVAHADGIGTRFQSDVRIVNVSNDAIDYEISFTPSGQNGAQVGKQTTLSIGANEVKSFDDVVKGWYGAGVLGEFGVGTIEIRPLNGANPQATFASSRTYAVEQRGTYGQFIPAILLDDFIGNIGANSLARISLQQVANSAAYRTNVGLVEGSGAGANAVIKLFDGNNNLLQTVERSLQPFGHEQLAFSQLFGNLTVNDGRIEVAVTSENGKATAYASVIDNATSDPLLVFPEQALRSVAKRYVVPGVAELENGVASNFHSDMRVFNAGSEPVTVTLNYYPQAGDATPRPASVQRVIDPGKVTAIDNVLPSVWNLSRTGGAVTLDTANDASLVVTARTYSRNEQNGTYGQFIPGVTVANTVGAGERALEVLQLEQSEQFRTNLGLVEVTGQGARVEITAIKPDSKLSAVTAYDLKPNEFIQFGRIFQSLGLPTVYGGRVSVKVLEGTGRVAAYGSVVDNRTVDPTYVPAQ